MKYLVFIFLVITLLSLPTCAKKIKPTKFKLLKGKKTEIVLSKNKKLSITYHGIDEMNLIFHDGTKKIIHNAKTININLCGQEFHIYTFSDKEIVLETYIDNSHITRGLKTL